MIRNERIGTLYVISSPSGVGKTTVANLLLSMDKFIVRSVSNTTRSPRIGEKNGMDYNFVSVEKFQQLINDNEMLEYAKVFTDYYGTPKKGIDTLLSDGKDILLCIDWQGALQIKKSKKDAITIFLLPPSFNELKRRLVNRNTDSSSVIDNRLNEARLEITKAELYDYAFINDDLSDTVDAIYSLIKLNRKNIDIHNRQVLIKNILH